MTEEEKRELKEIKEALEEGVNSAQSLMLCCQAVVTLIGALVDEGDFNNLPSINNQESE